MKSENKFRIALAAASLSGLGAFNVQASQLELYLSMPVRDTSLNAAVPDGALPWPGSYGQSYSIETFNNETPNVKTTGTWAIGTYEVAAGGNTNVESANQYGGAGTGTAMGSGGSNFLNAGTLGSPAGVTITLANPARYVGFWWSAGSNGNNVELLDEHDNVLTTMTTNELMTFLGSSSNFTAIGGASYTRNQYNGNPFTGNPGNGGEPYVYLNYVLKDTTANGATTIKKIRFWGAGFELDNVAIREEALPGLPGDTGLPPTWVPTNITKTFADPPVTADDAATTRIDTPSTPLNLTGNDPYAPDGSSVTPQTSSVNGGNISVDPQNPKQFIYTPAPGFHGIDTFTYQVCLAPPNQDLCATSTVTMTVVAPDVLVDLTNLPPTATVGVPYEGSFTCTNQGNADALVGTTCTTGPLPEGLSVQACTISPSNTAWAAGDTIPQGAVVTCPVSGTPANNKSTTTTTGSTGTTGDSEPSNNSTTKDITVVGVPDVVIDLSGLPPTGTVDVPYKGTFTCTNQGSSDMTSAGCNASGLPPGVAQGLGSCTIVTPAASTPTNWASPSAIPEGGVVTCPVEGTPTAIGTTTANGTGGSSTATRDIAVRMAVAPTAVPSLTAWATLTLAAMMAFFGLRRVRKQCN
ncbi:MAG: IPTL-CTERM sorting domain-containing protein [Comamonas sp.]